MIILLYIMCATPLHRQCQKFFYGFLRTTLNRLVDHSSPTVIVNNMVDYPKNPLDSAFAALADQTRRAILSQLLEQDLTVKQVADTYEMSLAAISKHLQVLSKAGLVRQIKQGREKICQLEPNALRAASLWMESFGYFPAAFLDGVEDELEALGVSQNIE